MHPVILYLSQDDIPIHLIKASNKTCFRFLFNTISSSIDRQKDWKNFIVSVVNTFLACDKKSNNNGFIFPAWYKRRISSIKALASRLRNKNLRQDIAHEILQVLTNGEKIVFAAISKTIKMEAQPS